MLFDEQTNVNTPNGWTLEPLGRVIDDIADGGTPPRDNPSYFGGGIAWAVISDVVDEIVETKETLTIRGLKSSNAKEWQPGSVILTTGATIGLVGVAKVPLATKQGITGIVPKLERLDSEYLAATLRNATMTLERFAQGSTFKEIRPPTLRKLRLLIPPKTEQAGIIQVLKSVDAAIKQSNALFGKLKHIKAGLMHDLLTRGLDRDGNLRDPVRHPKHFKDSPLGQLPVEWETFSFEQITVDDAPICYGIVQPGPFAEGGAPVLAIHNLNGNYLTNIHRSAQSIEKGYARSRVLPNDVLLSIKGTIGRVDIAPSWFSGNISRDIARIRLKPFASPSFVRHMLLAPAYQRRLELAVVGTTRPEISIGVLKQLKLPLPQIEEQQNIAAILDLQDACIRAEEANRNKLTAMKQGLMQDLLVGRKRVAALPSPNGTRL